MAHFDATSAECLVFTYKEGLLSAIAHDLKIRVAAFSIDVDEQTRAVAARFDPTSLRVVTAMQDGGEARAALTTENKRQIHDNILTDVLDAQRYPEITFASSSVAERDGEYLVKGTLMLHGHKRQLHISVHKRGKRYVAEARVHQPDFGIRPYTALLGALKVKADVDVRVTVPTEPGA